MRCATCPRQADGSGVDLIAEPYGIGANTFQLGHFPVGWAEWDDRYRYPIRRAQNKLGIGGNEVSPDQLITLFAGSSDIFQPSGRKPYHGINYVVVHDGFTLRDLYSFLHSQNNQPFPLGPSSGGADDNGNISWDQGGDPAAQRQAARTGMALLLVSAGVPIIEGGDEMYRTQFGNNNPFNLDNSNFYLDYSLRTQFPHHFNYAKAMIAFRTAHTALRRSDFFDGTDHNGNGLKDVTWVRDNGQEADAGYLAEQPEPLHRLPARRHRGRRPLGLDLRRLQRLLRRHPGDAPRQPPRQSLVPRRRHRQRPRGPGQRRVSPATAWRRDLHDRLPFSLGLRRATLSLPGLLFHRGPSAPNSSSKRKERREKKAAGDIVNCPRPLGNLGKDPAA